MQKKMTYLEIAKEVLQNASFPLRAPQIWDIAVKKGLDKNLTSIGKTPELTISALLYVNVRDKQDSIFMKASTNPTTFWLKARKNELQKELNYSKMQETNNQSYTKHKRKDFHERDLHPLFVGFAKDYFDAYYKNNQA